MADTTEDFDFLLAPQGSPDDFRAAAESGDIDRLKELMFQVSFIDCSDSSGRSALCMAAAAGQKAAAELLIGAGASVNGPMKKAGPLHAAAASGHANVVKLLLDSGADASKADASGVTPLNLAEEGGHTECKAALSAGL